MKKYYIASIFSIAVSSAFAALTIEDATYVDGTSTYTTETQKVSGAGSIADFGDSYKTSTLWLFGADIAINDASKTFELTSTGGNKTNWTGLSVFNGSAFYSMVVQGGANKITISNGGNLKMTANTNEISVYDSKSSLELTVAADAGTVDLKKVFVNNGLLTLNLHKENALSTSGAIKTTIGSAYSADGAVRINTSANQTFTFDFRNNTKSHFSITDGAIITVSSFGVWANATSNIILADGLVDGAFLLATSSYYDFDSYDRLTATLTLVSGSGDTAKTHYYKFIDAEGNALSNLSWSAVDGGYLLTGIVPEPAEWAAIFGALALLLVVYRKRR